MSRGRTSGSDDEWRPSHASSSVDIDASRVWPPRNQAGVGTPPVGAFWGGYQRCGRDQPPRNRPAVATRTQRTRLLGWLPAPAGVISHHGTGRSSHPQAVQRRSGVAGNAMARDQPTAEPYGAGGRLRRRRPPNPAGGGPSAGRRAPERARGRQGLHLLGPVAEQALEHRAVSWPRVGGRVVSDRRAPSKRKGLSTTRVTPTLGTSRSATA